MQQFKANLWTSYSIQEVKEAIADSVEASKTLLYSLFNHLKLNGEPVSTFNATSDEEIQALWEEIKKVDDTVSLEDTNVKSLESKKMLQDFMQSHCICRHYMFSVQKCIDPNCTHCKPPRLLPDVF